MPDPPRYLLGCPGNRGQIWTTDKYDNDRRAFNALKCDTCQLNCGGPRLLDVFEPVKLPDGRYCPCNGCFYHYKLNKGFDTCAHVCNQWNVRDHCCHPDEPCKEPHHD